MYVIGYREKMYVIGYREKMYVNYSARWHGRWMERLIKKKQIHTHVERQGGKNIRSDTIN